MHDILLPQYHLVAQSRAVLLHYCGTLAETDFVAENSSFGRGSIRNLLVHIGNAYEFWLGEQALRKEMVFTAYTSIATAAEAKTFFAETVDPLVGAFLYAFGDKAGAEIPVSINNNSFTASPLKLLTHVMTHEFHHKGQILSLSRHLGYTPVDTDVIR